MYSINCNARRASLRWPGPPFDIIPMVGPFTSETVRQPPSLSNQKTNGYRGFGQKHGDTSKQSGASAVQFNAKAARETKEDPYSTFLSLAAFALYIHCLSIQWTVSYHFPLQPPRGLLKKSSVTRSRGILLRRGTVRKKTGGVSTEIH